MNKVKKIFIFSSQKIFLIKCKSGVLCWWIKHENLFYSYVFVRRHCPKAKQVQSIYRAIAACEKPRSHFLGTKNAVPYLFFSRQRWKENLAIKCWTVYYIVLLYKYVLSILFADFKHTKDPDKIKNFKVPIVTLYIYTYLYWVWTLYLFDPE